MRSSVTESCEAVSGLRGRDLPGMIPRPVGIARRLAHHSDDRSCRAPRSELSSFAVGGWERERGIQESSAAHATHYERVIYWRRGGFLRALPMSPSMRASRNIAGIRVAASIRQVAFL